MPPTVSSPDRIRFGSDGYRGIIGDSFTWRTVERLVSGTIEFLRRSGHSGSTIPIGYDTRFMADSYAKAACIALETAGFKPVLASEFCPSPYLSYSVKKLGAPLGVMFTASHNPARYLGYKLKGPEGGSSLPEVNRAVEEYAATATDEWNPHLVFGPDLEYEVFDLSGDYIKTMTGYTGKKLGGHSFDLTIDFVHGTTALLYRRALEELGVGFNPLHTQRDPTFSLRKPEPLPEQLEELFGWTEAGGKSAFGAAFDGDGDRLGLIDEENTFVPPEDIFAICLLHLIEDRGMSGRIVKTVSFSSLIDRIAREFSLELVEVPVCFKHSTLELLKPGTLAAGEESGGIGFAFHLPERDALLTLILVLSAMAERGLSLVEMRRSIAERFGHPHFLRSDIPLANGRQVETVRKRLAEVAGDPSLIGLKQAELSTLDGIKLSYPEGFILFRFSGTEPLVRIYCEHAVMGEEKALLQRAKEYLFGG
jgi:phosphomannomutase